MILMHKYNLHHTITCYPEGDTHVWCQWCGLRQTIAFGGRRKISK